MPGATTLLVILTAPSGAWAGTGENLAVTNKLAMMNHLTSVRTILSPVFEGHSVARARIAKNNRGDLPDLRIAPARIACALLSRICQACILNFGPIPTESRGTGRRLWSPAVAKILSRRYFHCRFAPSSAENRSIDIGPSSRQRACCRLSCSSSRSWRSIWAYCAEIPYNGNLTGCILDLRPIA